MMSTMDISNLHITDNVSTTVNQKFAYVEIVAKKKKYRLRLRTKNLETKEGFFGGKVRCIKLGSYDLIFPSVVLQKEIEDLRGLWDKLIDYGFEPV